MRKWFLQRGHYGDCNSCGTTVANSPVASLRPGPTAALAQEANLHSKFHPCRMWNEISSALTSCRAVLSVRARARALIQDGSDTKSISSSSCRAFKIRYYLSSRCNLVSRECPFIRPLVNTIGCGGHSIRDHRIKSEWDSSPRRFSRFTGVPSRTEDRTGFFHFHPQLSATCFW